MKNFYLTFGQGHTHSHNGKTLDKDTVGVIQANEERRARELAFEWFGSNWSFLYAEKPDMRFFPKELIKLN